MRAREKDSQKGIPIHMVGGILMIIKRKWRESEKRRKEIEMRSGCEYLHGVVHIVLSLAQRDRSTSK